jgi:hypothetical protein
MPIILFLKAVQKKQIQVPMYTRKDGTVVQQHMATVNVSTDHDTQKVISGQGTHSQKKAHAELSKLPEWSKKSDAEKESAVLHHATHIQDTAVSSAYATFAKQKIIAGEVPSKREWEAFHAQSDSSHVNHLKDIHGAGKLNDYQGLHEHFGTTSAGSNDELTDRIAAHDAAKQAKKASKPAKGSSKIDPDRDSLLTAIAKLGGLDRGDAKAQGIDPAYFSTKGHGIKRVFHSKGMTFDDMAHNFLQHYGYPVSGANNLLDAIDTELSGTKVYTPNGHANAMENSYEEPAVLATDDIDDYGIEVPVYDGSEYYDMTDQDIADYDLVNQLDSVAPGAYNEIFKQAEEDGDSAEQFIRRIKNHLLSVSGEGGLTGQTRSSSWAGEPTDRAETYAKAEGGSESGRIADQGLDGSILFLKPPANTSNLTYSSGK